MYVYRIELKKKIHERSYDMGLTRKNNNISKAIAFYTHVQHLPRSLNDGVLFLSTLCSGKMTDLDFFFDFF